MTSYIILHLVKTFLGFDYLINDSIFKTIRREGILEVQWLLVIWIPLAKIIPHKEFHPLILSSNE